MVPSIIDQVFTLKCRCLDTEQSIFESAGISSSDFAVLDKVETGEALTVSDFAMRLNLSVSRASRVISRLVEDGLLQTEPAAEDRRKQRLTLSVSGGEAKRHIAELKEKCNRQILEALAPEEISALQSSLSVIMKTLDRSTGI